ncbi:MAG: Transketolase central region-containing protein [Candidatus Roizmanbacteria bacterium GW2011_GWA2_37_7]|uniref:Transketolase central region-containing protein n=1 Tax=Candidatus Roizmanbacteria bacterium GW2011_GWA2_37_7 TaxID=1618481 RepID=A0A0G0H902_9BACT|nr:MAG: Transketolase central region-containing protein [Candidatus Roizmanbacteria bacterium GW2011_GWA2_37_7]
MNIHDLTDTEKIEYLIHFENEIAQIYETAAIKGPIHLRGGNEKILIKIFKQINTDDTVFATWANHLEALLHCIPREKVKKRILDGHSMAMNFPEYNFYTSSIVNGISPIGVGVAWAIKKQNKDQKIFIFIGDMTFQSGATIESIRYSINFDLPCNWIIADNNLSVNTQTDIAWGGNIQRLYKFFEKEISYNHCKNVTIKYYRYKNTWPHAGTGTFVSF